MRASRGGALPRPGELARARAQLAGRLCERRGEIEESLLAGVYGIADPSDIADPSYLEGLKGALEAALEYGLEAIERAEGRPPEVPIPLLAQARLAARSGIGLDTVLRRYFAGYTMLGDFLAQEATELDLPAATLKRLLHAHAAAFDRLLVAVSEEHGREGRPSSPSTERRRLAVLQRLLAGERIEAAELAYDLDAHHLGLVAEGPGAEELVRSLAAELDRRLLFARPDERSAWAWLGGRQPLDPAAVTQLARSLPGAPSVLALGEPAEGLSGWRLTHRQAAAALSVARRGGEPLVRYADVALLAAALKDDLLGTSLRNSYLRPLEHGRDGGRVARQTLRAYLAVDCNLSSAAAKLEVSRTTIRARLRAVEAVLGRPLSSCNAELRVALHLEDAGI